MVRIFFSLSMIMNLTISLTQPASTTNRTGLMFSFGSGISFSHLEFPHTNQQNTDLALNWKIGYMINPKLAVLLNGSVSVYQYDLSDRPRKRDFGGVFPSLQYHISEKIWVLGGVGLGTDAPVFYDLQPENEIETNYYLGVGCIASAGYEIVKRKNFVVDLQARLNYSQVHLPIGTLKGFNSALVLGINLY